MTNGYTTIRRLKLTDFELRIAIEALNAKRLKQKASGTNTAETSNLILYLLDVLDSYAPSIKAQAPWEDPVCPWGDSAPYRQTDTATFSATVAP